MVKIELPPFVKKIIHTFEKEGHEIYIVGGVVRDLLIGRPKIDWDFTTNAHPDIIQALFPGSFYDNAFGTVGVIDPKEKKQTYYGKPLVYEITTFRKEVGYTDRRHPDKVIWGKTLEDDLIRRDFTINAIALKPTEPLDNGKIVKFDLIDPHCGQKDIKSRLIRAVGNPEKRFQEDALRMMRAVRIATQLGFNIEQDTFQAIKANLALLDEISAERIRDEFFKLISYEHAADGMMILKNSGLLAKILPELEKAFLVDQKSPGRHHLWDVGTHSFLSLKNCHSANPIVKLATLIHDIGKPVVFKKSADGRITFYNHEIIGASIAANIGRRLRLSKKDQERLVTLVRWHQFTVDERQTDSAIRRFIRNVGKENLAEMLILRTADRLGGGAKETSWRLEQFKRKLVEVQKQPFTVADLKVDGNDVMKTLKISAGPFVGRILDALFKEIEKDKAKNKREYLLKRIKQNDCFPKIHQKS